jgi:hypothetical protein
MQDSSLVKEMDEENEEDGRTEDGDDADDDDDDDEEEEEEEAQGDEGGDMATRSKSVERVKSWVESVRIDSPCECLTMC